MLNNLRSKVILNNRDSTENQKKKFNENFENLNLLNMINCC